MPSRSAALNGASVARRQDDIPTALESGSLFDWRKYLPVHPAAELFPLLPIHELADDLVRNGLRVPIVTWSAEAGDKPALLDGRNRLNALESLGLLYDLDGHIGLKHWAGTKWADLSGDKIRFEHIIGGDPYAIALSLNVHRRHLNAEQKRDLIAKLLKAKPEASNLSIAKQIKADDKTVASVRCDLEARSEIPNVETRTDKKGRRQPAKRKGKAGKKSNSVVESDSTTVPPAPIEAAADAAVRDQAGDHDADTNTTKPSAAPTVKDTALREFEGYICRQLQMIHKAKPERFAKLGAHADEVEGLGHFIVKVASAMRVAAVKRPPPEPTSKSAESLPELHRNPFQDWRKLPLSELEHRIETIRTLAGKSHHFDDAQWKQLDRMRERRDELRATERVVEAATRH